MIGTGKTADVRFLAMFRRRRRGVRLAPLIDVVFILLLFFMLTTGFVPWRQIDVSFPVPGEPVVPTELLIVQVVEEGRAIQIEGNRYLTDDASALAAFVGERPEAVFAVRGFPGMRTQTLVDVVDRLRRAGAAQVSLAKTES